jgi:hypothetical protein
MLIIYNITVLIFNRALPNTRYFTKFLVITLQRTPLYSLEVKALHIFEIEKLQENNT